MSRGKFKSKKGFTLVEIALVLSVATIIGFVAFSQLVKTQEVNNAQFSGEQIKKIGDSVNAYISNHYDTLSTLTNSTGSSSDVGPRTCNTATNSCVITVATLANEGLLPSTYSGKNVYGYGYNILLKRGGTSPYYKINGIVLTDGTLSVGNSVRYDLLGQAMLKAGIDSGMTNNSSSQVSGFNGSWTASNTDYSIINKSGLLAYQAGYGTYNYSVFLRRDGTLPMTGSLDMGSNSIKNSVDYTGSGNITNGGNISAGGTGSFTGSIGAKGMNPATDIPTGFLGGLVTPDLYGIGGFYLSKGDSPSNQNWAFKVLNSGDLTTAGNIYGGSSIYASGLTSTSRNSLFSGEGAVVTKNLQATSTIGAGNATTLNAYMNSGGNIYAGNDILSQHYIYTRDSTGTVIKAYLNSDGNIYASGNIQSAGSITSGGRLTANEFIQINGVASLNASCSPNGVVGRDSAGSPLNCVSGTWVKAGYTYSAYSVSFSSSSAGSSSTTYQTTSMGKHLFCFLTGIQTADGLTKHVYISVSGGSWTLEQRTTLWPAGISTWAYATCAD